MTSSYLQISDLSHYYLRQNIRTPSLKSINLSIGKGELLGLIGPSGSGKTTLLRLIAGFEKPSSGFISIQDQIVSNNQLNIPPEKRRVGMVFQDYALFPHLNAWENVCFGLPKRDNKQRALWLLESLGLLELRFRYPHELSGGQKQRLALARALAPGNSFVLLDEPFSNLDVDVRYRLRSELKSVLDSCSASAILVTHDSEEALAICDRIAVIKNGEIHQCSTPNDLVDFPQTSFVGRFALHRNVLPSIFNSGELITPFGNFSENISLTDQTNYELLVDETSLSVNVTELGESVVVGREFLGNSWRLRLLMNEDLQIRVLHPLDSPPQIGEKCHISYKKGKNGILFPGSMRIQF